MNENVSKRSSLVDAIYDKWYLIDCILGGTEKMREAGEIFLPRHPKESLANYTRRKNSTFFTNYFSRTVEQGTSKVFSKEIAIENLPPILEDFVNNVDRYGQDLTRFFRKIFFNAVAYGSSYWLVDFPKVEEELNLAEFEQQNLRPYLVEIPTMDVLDVKYEIFNNTSVLTKFRFKQNYIEKIDEFTDEIKTQVKVFTYDPETQLVGYEVYREDQEHKGSWVVYDAGILNISQIPIVILETKTFYPGIGTPPLYDLAQMNVLHWQSSSDQRNILTIARVPMLFAKKLNSFDLNGNRKEIEISPNTVIESDDPDSSVSWIEHSGKAIEAGREDLKDIEEKMMLLGLELYVNRTGNVTATEMAINSAETNSLLVSFAVMLRDCIERTFEFVCEFYDIEMNFNVNVNTEFSFSFKKFEDFNQLFEMYKEGLITGKDLIVEAKRRNMIRYNFDETQIIERSVENDNQI